MLGAKAIIDLLGSPVFRALALVAAFLAWTAYQRQDAAQTALKVFRAEIAAEVAEAQQARAEAAKRLAEEARVRADESSARANSIERDRDGIVEDFQNGALGDCAMSDELRDRLLAIGS